MLTNRPGKRHITRQVDYEREHHQCARSLVRELLRTAPFSPDPLLVQQKLVEFVGQSGWGESPGTLETRTATHERRSSCM